MQTDILQSIGTVLIFCRRALREQAIRSSAGRSEFTAPKKLDSLSEWSHQQDDNLLGGNLGSIAIKYNSAIWIQHEAQMLGKKIKASPPEIKDVRFRRKHVAFILVNAILHVFV